MSNRIKRVTAAATFAGAVALSTMLSQSHAQMAMPFGGEEDVAFAEELWSTLEAARFVGANRINTTAFEGNEPHGAIQQVLAGNVEVTGRSGRAVVKLNHMGEGADTESVYNDPDKFMMAYTVMFKREAGYDPENKDWFWARYDPSGALMAGGEGMPKMAGRVAKGMEEGCIACHTATGGADLEVLTPN